MVGMAFANVPFFADHHRHARMIERSSAAVPAVIGAHLDHFAGGGATPLGLPWLAR